MDNIYIVITELVAVVVVMAAIFWLVLRDKRQEIQELNDANDSLMRQLEEAQALIGEHREGEEGINASIEAINKQLHNELDQQISGASLDAEQNATQTKEQLRLLKQVMNLIGANGDDIDINKVITHMKHLSKSLQKSERMASLQAKEINKTKESIKALKEKVKDLSQKTKDLRALEVKGQRLERDKERLKERLQKVKEKYEQQKVIISNLRSELKTSFRAEELQGLREELNHTEAQLARSLTEKSFIESHYVSLDEMEKDREALQDALNRAHRENKLLEKTLLDLESDEDENIPE